MAQSDDEAGQRASAIRQARIGLRVLSLLLLAAAAVTVTLFLVTRAFDAEGIAMFAGAMVSYLLAGVVAARIFLRETRRLKNRSEPLSHNREGEARGPIDDRARHPVLREGEESLPGC
jgi:hypothetical protein